MEILKNAFNLTSKYGISLNKFGPFLSFVDKKIGLCLDIKDSKYGFLTRNYCFNTINEFEEFIKKYSYYKNTLKGNTNLSLDNYFDVSPKLKYGFDEKILVDQENEQKIVQAIKMAADNLYMYLNNLYKSRIEQIELRTEAHINMINNLMQYKESLHKFYKKTYQEDVENNDESLYNYRNKTKGNLKTFKNNINKLKKIQDIESLKNEIKLLVEEVKRYELDHEYYSLVYDLYLFKNKAYLLEQMNNHILNVLESEKNVTPQELKTELEAIKEQIVFSNNKESFIKDQLTNIEEKYSGIADLKEYNIADYLNKSEFTEIIFKKFVDKKPVNKTIELIKKYNEMNESNKRDLLILFSPLKKIINYIITIKSSSLKDYEDYKHFYMEMVDYFNMPDNLIFKKKYFSLIDFNSFESFIYSLIKFTDKINDISFKLEKSCLVWSYSNDKKLIYASLNVLKSTEEFVNCLFLKKGTNVIYSAKKIRIVNEKFVIEDNNDLFIPKTHNNIDEIDGIDEVINFKPQLKKINLNNKTISIVDKMEKIGVYKFKNYNVGAKENE